MNEPRNLISLRDFTSKDVVEIFRLASDMKKSGAKYRETLSGKTLALLFQKPSTRTRVSFQVAMAQLGGVAIPLRDSDLQLSRGESLGDTARVLSAYTQGIVGRMGSHSDLVELAKHSTVPVINGLTDLLHPCQALADYFTLTEKKGPLHGRKFAYIGDGNNMCHSLLYGATRVGMNIAVATPAGYEPKSIILKSVNREAKHAGIDVVLTEDPSAAAEGADAVYTDTWLSMGRESEEAERLSAFRGYQVDANLMRKAQSDALFMHCLPAHRGQEVAADVIDGAQSVVWLQAENRLHVQKAILYLLMRA
ncbi:MAG TPA: ornithine carbamoyltransferase [Vicinamibacteria bacterium]|nr:ornithine carbamoyltransferase [Vicinamibacteria bacterium]